MSEINDIVELPEGIYFLLKKQKLTNINGNTPSSFINIKTVRTK